MAQTITRKQVREAQLHSMREYNEREADGQPHPEPVELVVGILHRLGIEVEEPKPEWTRASAFDGFVYKLHHGGHFFEGAALNALVNEVLIHEGWVHPGGEAGEDLDRLQSIAAAYLGCDKDRVERHMLDGIPSVPAKVEKLEEHIEGCQRALREIVRKHQYGGVVFSVQVQMVHIASNALEGRYPSGDKESE